MLCPATKYIYFIHSLYPQAQLLPSAIPEPLLDLLIIQNPDWLSPTWTMLWSPWISNINATSLWLSKMSLRAVLSNSSQPSTNYRAPPVPVCVSPRIVSLHGQGLPFGYLSHIEHHLPDKAMSHLELVLRGIKSLQAKSKGPVSPRLPITPDLLLKIKQVCHCHQDDIMLWAEALLCFSGFL